MKNSNYDKLLKKCRERHSYKEPELKPIAKVVNMYKKPAKGEVDWKQMKRFFELNYKIKK
jgi:hypothetical protein